MEKSSHFHLRASRDRLVDLLGIGETYPLADLPVADKELTVAFGTTAKVPVQFSQTDVDYSLVDSRDDQTPLGDGVRGTGGQISLETGAIEEDITFKILAVKADTGRRLFLAAPATVKVGLDTTLRAEILDAPFADPYLERREPTADRIIDYGAEIEVLIEASQEGVDYCLVSLDEGEADQEAVETARSAEKRGDLHDIVLRSQALLEDTDLRVRATKTFDISENRDPRTDLLDVVLPVKVRADPAPAVAVVAPGPIVDFGAQEIEAQVTGTQLSAAYTMFTRPIADREFIHGETGAQPVLTVPVPDKPDVQVLDPASEPTPWSDPATYSRQGEPQPGTGKALDLRMSQPVTDDVLVFIRAEKEHTLKSGKIITSALRIRQAAVVLVKPDPNRDIGLSIDGEAGELTGAMRVTGGEPGVYYHFGTEPDGGDVALPVYFHQPDHDDPSINKGINQLGVEVDFSVAAEFTDPGDPAASPTRFWPREPQLPLDNPNPGDTLHILAVKARTGVEQLLKKTFAIDEIQKPKKS